MDNVEAKSILVQELSRYRERSYAELLSLVGRSEWLERASPSGAIYQIKVEAFFDDETRRTLRVTGAIDDGGWRALLPLCEDFILAPDGSFVGE